MPENNPRVTVIGLGAMGKALARAFVSAGWTTTVWNRSPGKAEDVVAGGATWAGTAAGAIAASPLVVICVLDYAVVREVLAAGGDALSGRVLVNLTNGTPRQARDMARWVAERGAEYLDGGIMAIPPGIATSQAFVLYSGSQVAFETHRRELDRLGTSHYLGADPGLASLHDLALLSGMYGMLAGALHAFALVGTEKVAATEFLSLLRPWLDAMATSLPRHAEQADTGNYTSGVVSNLGMQAAGFPNLIQASRDQGIRPDLMVPIQALIDQRVAEGHGAENFSSVIELIKNPDRFKGPVVSKYAGKKAVVAGGTHGIGLAIVQALLDGGVEVLLTGRNEQNIQAARRKLGPQAHVVRSDAASMADITALGDLVQSTLGQVDAVFINTGVAYRQPFEQATETLYDRTFAVNTKGAFFTVQRLIPLVRDGGSFVFTTSVADERGTAGMGAYAGSKAALWSFAQALAAELLPRRIRVNAVSPGFIDTPTMGMTEASEEARTAFSKVGDAITPMRRHGTPAEVAAAAMFLAFDATFTTGVKLPVDGGLGQGISAPPD